MRPDAICGTSRQEVLFLARYHSLQSDATAPAVGSALKLVSAVGNVVGVKGVDAGMDGFPADVV